MPYCPKCDMEFIDGITKCTDCGGPLVESKEVADQMKDQYMKMQEEHLKKQYQQMMLAQQQAQMQAQAQQQAAAEQQAQLTPEQAEKLAVAQNHPFSLTEHRIFSSVYHNTDNEFIKDVCRAADDIQMSAGHRIKAAGIDGSFHCVSPFRYTVRTQLPYL